jgi:hypothetical protein
MKSEFLRMRRFRVSQEHGRINMSNGPAFAAHSQMAGNDSIAPILYKMKCIFKKIFAKEL